MVGLLWVAYFINYSDRQVVFSIYPALKKDLHFSNAQLGLIGSTFLWVYALCMAVSGRVADIFPRDRIVIASLILWSLATFGSGTSPSVGAFLIWRGVMGVTESLYVPAAVGLIASLHSGATRSRALSLHSTAQLSGSLQAAGTADGRLTTSGGEPDSSPSPARVSFMRSCYGVPFGCFRAGAPHRRLTHRARWMCSRRAAITPT